MVSFMTMGKKWIIVTVLVGIAKIKEKTGDNQLKVGKKMPYIIYMFHLEAF